MNCFFFVVLIVILIRVLYWNIKIKGIQVADFYLWAFKYR